MDGKEKFIVEKLHSDDMIKSEVQTMLGAGKINLTLGVVESLWLLDSPYIKGGKVEPSDLMKAMELIPSELEPIDFHNALNEAIDSAFRIFEIIVPDDENSNAKHSEIEIFSPEWIADIVSQACNALPSLTYHQVLWEIPLMMVFHLVISNARKNGVITRRPDNMQEALQMLKAHNKKKKEI